MSKQIGFGSLLLVLVSGMGCAHLPVDGAGPEQGWLNAQRQARILVVLEPGPESLLRLAYRRLALDYEMQSVAVWTMLSLGAPCAVFELSPRSDASEVARRVSRDHRVLVAQPVNSFEVLADEGGFDDPYHHLQHGSAAMRTGAAQRWATGRGVRIAVIDTGVEIDHPDLTGRIVGARNFVDRGEVTFTSDRHGTSVAGVIAAVANNGEGIVGVAPDAGILALKACWPVAGSAAAARCDSYTLALAIDFAIQEEVEILNMSLAGPEDPLLALLVGKAIERGIVVVAARDDRASGAGAFPASLEGVISIGLPKDPAGGSGALVAPGTDVLTTVPRHSYDFLSGSSFAAAHASGVVALLLERNRALAPVEVADLLGQSLRWGRRSATVDEVPVIDACAAIGRLMRRQDCLDSVVAVEER